jgi:uncharacterized membrane protein
MVTFIRKNYLAIIITFFGVCGFLAAFVLSVEKIHIIKAPDAVLSCTINSTFNCATVMKTKYADMFGFPNSFMGIAGYAMAIVSGLVFFETKKFSKWFTWFTVVLTSAAFLISYYWLYLSAYVIRVFCPWCLVSTVSATNIFFAVLTVHFQEKNLTLQSFEIWDKIANSRNRTFLVAIWYILAFIFAVTPFVWDEIRFRFL